MKSMKRSAIAVSIAAFTFAALSLTACPTPDNDEGTTPSATHIHQWGEWLVTTPATCTKKGVETKVCALNATHTETRDIPIDPAAHQWGNWDAETEPTCTEKGKGSRICTLNTSHKETGADIPALGHDYRWETIKAATCSAKGEETGTCSHDASYTTTREIPIDPDAHDWEQLAGTAPTCTETGSGSRKCKICNKEETLNVIPALGHDFGNWTETTAPTCTTAGVETGTCIHDGTTTTTRPVPINSTAHDWGNWTETTAPTCTTAGAETRTCTHDAMHKETRAVPIDPTAHDYEWVVTTPATYLAEGVETEICKHDSTHTRNTRPGDPQLIYTTTSIADLGTWLSSQPTNTATTAFKVKLNVNDITDLKTTLNDAMDKYVYLDLSGSTINQIEQDAFSNCTNLTSITIPDSVTEIGRQAFVNCTSSL